MMTKLMKNRVGIVTAGGNGIGRASALAFAKEGAMVVVADINEESGQETVRLIKKIGGDATFVYCNVAEEHQVIDLVNKTIALYGKLDWAHNHAGVSTPQRSITETESMDWDKCFQVTTTGLYYCLKYEITEMLKTGGGAIVNTSSTAGLQGSEGSAAYSAAKWGVNGLTKSVALEYAKKGIRVNSICPGMTRTNALKGWEEKNPEQADSVRNNIPLGRVGRPEDQANAALWLCSDKAAYITGVNLPVDGGATAK